MTHGDVVNLIKESGLHVRLTIGCPKEGAPILNQAQTSPGISSQHHQSSSQQQPQMKNENSTYFDRSHLSQHPQL